jgi:hypothetical protein
MRDHPEEAAKKLTATTATSPLFAPPINQQQQQQMDELGARVQEMEKRVGQLTRQVADAQQVAVIGIEDIRRDSSAVSRLAGDHVGSLTAIVNSLSQRVESLEKQVALLAEEGGGRYEAIQTALCQMASQVGQQNRMVEGDVAQLKQGLNNLIVALRFRSFPGGGGGGEGIGGGGEGGSGGEGGAGGGGQDVFPPTPATEQQPQQQQQQPQEQQQKNQQEQLPSQHQQQQHQDVTHHVGNEQ